MTSPGMREFVVMAANVSRPAVLRQGGSFFCGGHDVSLQSANGA